MEDLDEMVITYRPTVVWIEVLQLIQFSALGNVVQAGWRTPCNLQMSKVTRINDSNVLRGINCRWKNIYVTNYKSVDVNIERVFKPHTASRLTPL